MVLGLCCKAQEKTCKALLKGNRHKKLLVGNQQLKAYGFSTGGVNYELRHDNGLCRVRAIKGNRELTRFLLKPGGIEGPVYTEYDEQGEVSLIDSIDLKKGKHKKTYPGYFTSYSVYSSTLFYKTGHPSETTFYSLLTGKDSLVKAWYRNDFPKSMSIRNKRGKDSVLTKWDSTGILRETVIGHNTCRYYPSGILQTKITRVRMQNPSFLVEPEQPSKKQDAPFDSVWCDQEQSFYPDGTLKSTGYYNNGRRCLTWSYYNAQGKFERRTNEGRALNDAPVSVAAPEIIYDFLNPVEQSPEFPGGQQKLYQYMHMALADVLCKSDIVLHSSYNITYTVDKTGQAAFVSIDRQDTGNLPQLLKPVFEAIPAWKPGLYQSIPVRTEFVMELIMKE